jgi:hypothetical protein
MFLQPLFLHTKIEYIEERERERRYGMSIGSLCAVPTPGRHSNITSRELVFQLQDRTETKQDGSKIQIGSMWRR